MTDSITFTKNEASLALTTIVAWANGILDNSQIDTRVQMILEEGITQTEVDEFQEKYDAFPDNFTLYNAAIKALSTEPTEVKARVCAWMWQVANVGTNKNYKFVDLSFLEEVTEWQNKLNYVDVEELNIINKTRKDLHIDLDSFKTAFKNLPVAKRI